MIPQIALQEPVGPPGAPLLVLGPSLGTSTAVWSDAAGLLEQHFRVAAWDLPGHGAAPAATDAFSVRELADAVVDAVDRLGDERFYYAGVSLGGAVGLELAIAYPERLLALTVVCSGAVISTPGLWRDRAASIRITGTGSLTQASAARWFAPASLVQLPGVTSALLDGLGDVDDESYALCCEALASYDVRDELSGLALPVQVVWGEHDAVTPEASARYIVARVQDGVLIGVRDASHLAPAERPDEVAGLLKNFFERAGVAA